MEAWTFDSRDPEQTREAGRALGRSVGVDGLVIALIGPLGAGKTVFVKGLAEGLGVDPRVVSSPTFVIAQQYRTSSGPAWLHHVDLYRLESQDELESIGFDDMFAPGAVLAVEWADRFPGVLGRELLRIELEGPGRAEQDAGVPEDSGTPLRRVRVTADGEGPELVLADWAERLEKCRRARPGGGSFVEMRLMAKLLLALALTVVSLALVRDAPDEACDALLSSLTDELGTSHVSCLEQGSPPRPALEGVGAILAGGRIDLNRASPRLLETLPGIGPVRAGAIAAARSTRPFERVADLERVSGIGPKTVLRLSPWLEVRSSSAFPLRRANEGSQSQPVTPVSERRDG